MTKQNKSIPKQKPSINVYHKLEQLQLGKHRTVAPYFKMYKIGKTVLNKIEADKNAAAAVHGVGSQIHARLGWKKITAEKVFKKQLKATVRGFGGDPDFFVSNK